MSVNKIEFPAKKGFYVIFKIMQNKEKNIKKVVA